MDASNIFDKYGKKILISEIQWVCKEHQLGDFQRVIQVLGKTNTNILVETQKGKYVLRYLTFPGSQKRIIYIEDTILCLKKAFLPVENAIPNKSGDCYSYINSRMIQVYRFIEGVQFSFKPNQLISSGDMLNQFHAALRSQVQGPSPSYLNHPSEENLEKKMNDLYKKQKYISNTSLSIIESLYSSIIKQWEKENKDYLPRTIIHDDWHPWNQLYDKADRVICILDLDGVQQGLRIYDVAYSIYHIYKNAPRHFNKAYSKIFLNGYGALTNEEKTILPLVIAKVGLFFIIRSVKETEKELKDTEPVIQFLLSKEGKGLFL
ncbi:phosphotransferase [Ectobacillus funiculus]|uniref:Phosphotransferase n=1 Tax=Ectobacillus funiculus TaxID=137993 RepID=A0ABV5WPY8_9BACI